MKWFLFFVSFITFFSCRNENKPKISEEIKSGQENRYRVVSKNNDLPREISEKVFGNKTGYFINQSVNSVSSIGSSVTYKNMFNKFLINNLDTTNIILHNKYGLFHSCWISADTTIRIDTLNGEGIVIIQKVNIKNDKLLSFRINGRPVDTNTEDILDYDAESFRDFDYKGTDFYYITARIMGTYGGSAGLIIYHLLYNKKHHSVSTFTTFRVDGYNYLGDINEDDRLDFLAIENEGGYGVDSINHFKINLYSCNNKTGDFEMLQDKSRKKYFIEGNTNTDRYLGDSMNITKSYWPKPIK